MSNVPSCCRVRFAWPGYFRPRSAAAFPAQAHILGTHSPGPPSGTAQVRIKAAEMQGCANEADTSFQTIVVIIMLVFDVKVMISWPYQF